MATTGRGNEPLNSSWFQTNTGRLGARRETIVRKPVRAGTDGVAYKAVWSDFFFEAATGGTHYTLVCDTRSYSLTGVNTGLKIDRKL